MTVALSPVAMRLSELIIVYLAAAAPVGVAYFLRQRTHARHPARLLRATGIALVWPLTLSVSLLPQRRNARRERDADATSANAPNEARVATAAHALVSTLHQTEDLLRDAYAARSTRARQATMDARATIERLVGLALALAETKDAPPPATRELELCRIAGRKGDDLMIAGHCLRRRNLARLHAHHEQARTDMIHALAELLETIEHDLPARPPAAQTFTQLYWLVIGTFAQTIDLLSLLDDQQTVTRVARLLDAACAWARRHDVLHQPRAAAAQIGDLPCLPQTPPSGLTRPMPQPTA